MTGGHEEQWTNAELVRAVKALVESMDRFEGETRAAVRRIEEGIPEKYVTKELLAARLAPVSEHRNNTLEWVRAVVAPMAAGLVVAVITLRGGR